MSFSLNTHIAVLKKEIRRLLSLGFGSFLFVLFFEPFPLNNLDFNNRLIFVAGISAILFFFSLLLTLFNFSNNHKPNTVAQGMDNMDFLVSFVYLVLVSTGLAFYLRYVGFIQISFFIMFKIVLISIGSLAILKASKNYSKLKSTNSLLVKEKKATILKIEKYENDYLNKTVEFTSENKNENIRLLIADVAVIKSADNYVEIIFKEEDKFKVALVRNALKNIEKEISVYSNFIRCHRTAIVNTHFIEKLNTNYNNHSISVKSYDKTIPVSRQYLIKIKEAII